MPFQKIKVSAEPNIIENFARPLWLGPMESASDERLLKYLESSLNVLKQGFFALQTT